MAGRGLGAAEEHVRSTAGRGGIFHVRLKADQESCKLRFLTEHDDIFWGEFHKLMDANGRFSGWEACPMSYGQPCSACGENARPQTQLLAWVYEYYHDYTKPAEGRTPVKVGTVTRYREQVNEARLWRYSIMHRGAMKMRADRFGTITDRDYEFIRAGEEGTTRPTYMLEPCGEASPLPANVAEAVKNLPDLEDVALGRVTSLTGEKVEATGGAYPVVDVPGDADQPAAVEGDDTLPEADDLPF